MRTCISMAHRIEPFTRDNIVALERLANGAPISGYCSMIETPGISADFETTEALPHSLDAMARRPMQKPSPFFPKNPDMDHLVGPLCHTSFHHPRLTKFYRSLRVGDFELDFTIVPDQTGWTATASSKFYPHINGQSLHVEYTEEAGESHRWMKDDFHEPNDVPLIANAINRHLLREPDGGKDILLADAFTFSFGATFGDGVYSCHDLDGISVLLDSAYGAIPYDARCIMIEKGRKLGCLRIPGTRYSSDLYGDACRLRALVQHQLDERGIKRKILDRRWIVWPRHATPIDPP